METKEEGTMDEATIREKSKKSFLDALEKFGARVRIQPHVPSGFTNSQERLQNVVRESKGHLKAQPKDKLKIEPKALPKAEPKVPLKAEPKVLPRAEPKVRPSLAVEPRVLPKAEPKPHLGADSRIRPKYEFEVEQFKPVPEVNPKCESHPQLTCLFSKQSPAQCGCVDKHRITPGPANQVCSCERVASLDNTLRKIEMEKSELAKKLHEKEEELSAALKKVAALSPCDTQVRKDDVSPEVKAPQAATPPPPPPSPQPPPPQPPPPPPPPLPPSSPPLLTSSSQSQRRGHQFTVQPPKVSIASSSTLPPGLKPKTVWEVTNVKRAYWKPINPTKLNGNCFWLKVQEEKLASTELLRSLITQFSTIHRKNSTIRRNPQKGPKESDLTKLIGNLTINFLVGVQRSLKQQSNDAIKISILACECEAFSVETLDNLLMYLPRPEILEEIRKVTVSKDDLAQIHQDLLYKLAGINMLFPRLESMRFKIQQPEMVQDIKPKIETGIAACKNVYSSGKLKRILELILLFGNIMNSGSSTGQAYAFEMSFLSKLVEVKDTQNKTSLLHFLVDTIEEKFPDLLTFKDDLIYVHTATNVSIQAMGDSLKDMEDNVSNLERILKEHVAQNNDDKFSQVMGPFAKQARKDNDELNARFRELKTAYNDLADYFALDKTEYNTENFFLDLKSFIDAFTELNKERARKREAEKARKMRELLKETKEAGTLNRQRRHGEKDFKTEAYRMMAEEDRLEQEANGRLRRNNYRIIRRSFPLNHHGTL